MDINGKSSFQSLVLGSMIFLGKLQMRNHSALIIDKDGAFPPSCLCVSPWILAIVDRVNCNPVWQRRAFWFLIVTFESENLGEILSSLKHLSVSNACNIMAEKLSDRVEIAANLHGLRENKILH